MSRHSEFRLSWLFQGFGKYINSFWLPMEHVIPLKSRKAGTYWRSYRKYIFLGTITKFDKNTEILFLLYFTGSKLFPKEIFFYCTLYVQNKCLYVFNCIRILEWILRNSSGRWFWSTNGALSEELFCFGQEKEDFHCRKYASFLLEWRRFFLVL